MKPLPDSLPNDPLIVRIMREFKRGLMQQESEQMAEMARRWLAVQESIEAKALALASEIERLRANNQPVGDWKLAQMERYQQLLAQAQAELEKYSRWASNLVEKGQGDYLNLALEQSSEAIQAALIDAGYSVTFNRMPVSALQNMIGLAGDSSPLYDLFKASWPQATGAMLQTLVNSFAQGTHPLETARQMARSFGVGLQRAMTIARTEQLRVYREASRQQYQASGVVQGYYRLSARDSRVCPACLIADNGQVIPLSIPFEEHPQGRCTTIPYVPGRTPTWQTGQAWFEQQDARMQQTILGKGHYNAWRAGLFELPQIVMRVDNPTWGASLQVRPLKELVTP